eukprot:TRINITY_DN23804_c0_g1_i1.p1 TRINITY_DN23804_c0_g1~~TRINITY_DN23804_c0_g1_i1.p1  ORF type:complete len:153 (-),score=3.82 TRINITY_DN23804_c0_g1_i1:114-572(-)
MVDSLVRLPPTDAEIVRSRSKLQWHCQQFERKENKLAVISRYLNSVNDWAADMDAHSADIMKHAVHVAAWLAFASDPEGDLLEKIVSLLGRMLTVLAGIHLVPRLRLALYHAVDRLNDLCEQKWVTNTLVTDTLALVNFALGRLPSGGSLHL